MFVPRGEVIPIPHTPAVVDIHSKLVTFSPEKGDLVLLLFPTEVSNPLALFEEIKHEGKISDVSRYKNLYNMGVLATIDSIGEPAGEQYDPDSLDWVWANINAQMVVFIDELYWGNDCVLADVIEGFNIDTSPDVLPEDVDQLKGLIEIVRNAPTMFNEDLIQQLNPKNTLGKNLDLLADWYIPKNDERLSYILHQNYLMKYKVLSDALIQYTSSRNSSKKLKTKKYRYREVPIEEFPLEDTHTGDYNSDDALEQIKSYIHISKSPPTNKKYPTLSEKIAKLPLPPEVRDSVDREVRKLSKLSPNSSEFAVVEDYLEWINSIPWGKYKYDKIDLAAFVDNLNETHYGLADVKESILEHMVVSQIADNKLGTVLCFVGEPGTGKTSIARRIAAVSGRPVVQIALGGVTDESEIRGHRRTYLGSRPGRIISKIKTCKSLAPVIILDEVDKIGSGHKGDPASALLEVLDPEQNSQFTDRYLEVPVDLSQVMFICTANYRNQIPPALQDRMEFIQFRNYEQDERRIMVNDYLVKKVIELYSAQEYDITFSDEVKEALSEYPSVREIERLIRALVRKALVALKVNEQESFEVTMDTLELITKTKKKKKPAVGFGS